MIPGLSEEGLVQQGNVFLEVFLVLWVDPLLEIDEVKRVVVVNALRLQPFHEEREILIYLLSVENPVDHMAAKESHLDFVSDVTVDVFVLVDMLENVWCRRSVR